MARMGGNRLLCCQGYIATLSGMSWASQNARNAWSGSRATVISCPSNRQAGAAAEKLGQSAMAPPTGLPVAAKRAKPSDNRPDSRRPVAKPALSAACAARKCAERDRSG